MRFQLKEESGAIAREGDARITPEHNLLVWGNEYYDRHPDFVTGSGDEQQTVAVFMRRSPDSVIDLDLDNALIEATTPIERVTTGNVVIDRGSAETSPEIGSKGAALMSMDDDEMRLAAIDQDTLPLPGVPFDGEVRLRPAFCANVRSIAASAVRQLEDK